MALPVNIRVCDRMSDAGADKAGFMQALCDELAGRLRAAGAAGGAIEDVVWLPAGKVRAQEGAIVVARPAAGGFEGMTADACRRILRERIAAAEAARAAADAEGRLL